MLDQYFGYVWNGIALMMFLFYIYHLLSIEFSFAIGASAVTSNILYAGGTRLWVQCGVFISLIAVTVIFFRIGYRFLKVTERKSMPLSGRVGIALVSFDENSIGFIKVRDQIYTAKVFYNCSVQMGQPVRIISITNAVAGVVAA